MLGLSRTQHQTRFEEVQARIQREYFESELSGKDDDLGVGTTKQCNECKETKPITNFSMDKNKKKDGLQAKCKQCQAKYMKRYFQTKIGIKARSKATKRYLAKIA